MGSLKVSSDPRRRNFRPSFLKRRFSALIVAFNYIYNEFPKLIKHGPTPQEVAIQDAWNCMLNFIQVKKSEVSPRKLFAILSKVKTDSLNDLEIPFREFFKSVNIDEVPRLPDWVDR
jgi:hypothetical protein